MICCFGFLFSESNNIEAQVCNMCNFSQVISHEKMALFSGVARSWLLPHFRCPPSPWRHRWPVMLANLPAIVLPWHYEGNSFIEASCLWLQLVTFTRLSLFVVWCCPEISPTWVLVKRRAVVGSVRLHIRGAFSTYDSDTKTTQLDETCPRLHWTRRQ